MEGPPVHELIVTGPQRERLYELFARVYEGRSDVVVRLDRRRQERRRAGVPSPDARDGRRSDRRSTSALWVFPPRDAEG